MRAGRPWGSRASVEPEALAARLPAALHSQEGLNTLDAYKSRAAAVAEWLNARFLGQGWEPLPPMAADITDTQLRQRLNEVVERQERAPLHAVLRAAGVGLDITDMLRQRLASSNGA